jgi:type I restriction enzyme S subunit
LIELLKEKRQAVISHAVTKGLNPEIPMTASEVDWLSETPAHWSGIPLGFLIRFVSGGTPNKANEAYWDGDVPWVSPKDMKVFEISDAEDHVTELALNETGLRLVQPDHVLVVVRGMILLHSFPAARNLVPVTINQDMKALKCCNKLLPSFLLYLFRGIAKLLVSFAGESAHGTKKMETSVLSGLQIPLPPTEEQQAITVWLNDKVAGYDSLLANSADAIQLLGQRRATLISAAVTGRIDVRNYTPKEAA